MDFYGYYGKHRHKKSLVLQNNVIHKGKTLQLRLDYELLNNIEKLAKELNQNPSKVAKDILRDFFLDQKIKQQKFEISDI